MEYETIDDDFVSTTTDLDSFLSGVYIYYLEKGFVVWRCVSSLVASLFTFFLSVVLLLLVDWGSVLNCVGEEACKNLSLFYSNPFVPFTFYRLIIVIQLLFLGIYTVLLATASAIAKIRQGIRISRFYKVSLGIAHDYELVFLTWPEIVKRIIAYQSTAPQPLCIVQSSLSALEITNIIMRTENFVMYLGEVSHMSASVTWCLKFGLVAWLFDERYRIQSDRISVTSVCARLRLIGWVSLALVGPLMIFTFILLVIRELDNIRSKFWERDWTQLAFKQWYSEMDHFRDFRLEAGRESANLFVSNRFDQNEGVKGIAKFLAGGLLTVLALVGLLEDKALVYLNFGGRNLFFYVAILSVIVKMFSGDVEAKNINVHEKLKNKKSAGAVLGGSLCVHLPFNGSTNEHRLDGLSRIFEVRFFQFRWMNFLREFLSVGCIPYYFLHKFPKSDLPRRIVHMVNFDVFSSENLGDFCQFGWFKNAHANIDLSKKTIIEQVPFDVAIGAISFYKTYRDMYVPCLEIERLLKFVHQFSSMFPEQHEMEYWYFALYTIVFHSKTNSSLFDDVFLSECKKNWETILNSRQF